MSKVLSDVANDIGDTTELKKLKGYEMSASMRSKIDITDIVTPGLRGRCWAWLGAHDAAGYARVRIGRRVGYVRRELLRCAGIELADDDQVAALCGHNGCVNPDHHVVGSDNDVRAFTGKASYLGVGDLIVSKQLVDSGKASLAYIAFAYGVSARVISEGIRRCCRSDL